MVKKMLTSAKRKEKNKVDLPLYDIFSETIYMFVLMKFHIPDTILKVLNTG